MKRSSGFRQIKEGFVSAWRHKAMSVASVGSVSVALLILGVALLIVLNVNAVVEKTRENFDQMQIYLSDDLGYTDVVAMGKIIEEYPEVLSIQFISKDDALAEMKANWGDQAELLENLDTNPLPNSYIIQLNSIYYAKSALVRLSGLGGVEKIRNYNQDMINRLIEMTDGLRTFSVGLILALILVSVFIISNTIKLAVEGRKDEIFIMKSVGATNGFIRGPFVVEGIILGMVGAGIAFGVLLLGYMNIANLMEQAGISFIVSYLIPLEGILQDIIILFGTLGIGIGALGSLSAVKKQLGRKKA